MTRWNRRLLFGAMVVLVPALALAKGLLLTRRRCSTTLANFTGDTTKNGISFSNVFVLGAAPNGPAVAGGWTGSSCRCTPRTATS